jgi:3'-phosphoadenosine 5'-phosphosulfate sulfotransferase (PAPS reductase)/FAD synthetase
MCRSPCCTSTAVTNFPKLKLLASAWLMTGGPTWCVVAVRRLMTSTTPCRPRPGPRRAEPPEFWDQFNTDFPSGAHVRIHPLLGWTEIDIWRYIAHEAIPVVELYFAKDGKRDRSLGERGHSEPMISSAATVTDIIAELETTTIAERAGRAADHKSEGVFECLRVDGHA